MEFLSLTEAATPTEALPPRMLKLTEQQSATLCIVDEHNFVAGVRENLVRLHPKLQDDPKLLERLLKAYRWAKRLGIQRDETLVAFLCLDAEAPEFYRRANVARWLANPVGTPYDKFESLLSALSEQPTQK
jgi:hypothetical protein